MSIRSILGLETVDGIISDLTSLTTRLTAHAESLVKKADVHQRRIARETALQNSVLAEKTRADKIAGNIKKLIDA